MPQYREQKDTLGTVQVQLSRLWGAQTQRSLQNFNISRESDQMPTMVIKALGILKKCSAKVNVIFGLDPSISKWIVAAADEVVRGDLNAHFPLVVWQTGSGTQSNMNANEVIARRAVQLSISNGTECSIHPNDHVNMSQSSNDSFPTVMHIATAIKYCLELLPAIKSFLHQMQLKAHSFNTIYKIGRTHLQDATPMTLGQEFGAFAFQIDKDLQRLEYAFKDILEIGQGGTAVGTGLNTFEGFDEEITKEISLQVSRQIGQECIFRKSQNKFQALASHDALVQFHGSLTTLAVSLFKISNDIRMLASGPRCGLGELLLPQNEPGSSIMPGKVNPTQCQALTMLCAQVIGNNTAVNIGGMSGQFQLNTFKPLIIRNVLHSMQLLSDGCNSFLRHCLQGIQPNLSVIQQYVHKSLMLVTALNPLIGYQNSAKISKYAHKHNTTLKEAALELKLISAEQFDKCVKPQLMVSPKKYQK